MDVASYLKSGLERSLVNSTEAGAGAGARGGGLSDKDGASCFRSWRLTLQTSIIPHTPEYRQTLAFILQNMAEPSH